MARKKRDYKAEYARRKQLAQKAGYKSEREYKRVRRQLKLPRRASPVPKRILPRQVGVNYRAEAREWSRKHSRVPNSRYRASMSDAQAQAYWFAYVDYPDSGSRRGKSMEKRKRIWDYFRTWIPGYEDTEWQKEWTSDLQSV